MNPVAAVLRVNQDLLVEDVDKTRLPGPEADVAFAMPVGGGEEEHLLAGDEGAHLRVEIPKHLILVKGFGSFPVAITLLQIMFAARAGGHHLLLCTKGMSWCSWRSGRWPSSFRQERDSDVT
jgi:hypothetical protein